MSNTYKRFSLMTMMAMVFSVLLLVPGARGASGSDPGTAPIMAPGFYPDESRYGVGYYNVSGSIGSNLTAIITYTVNASKIALLAPNGTQLDLSNTASGVEVVSIICNSNQMYTLRLADSAENCVVLYRYFTLTICLDGDCGQSDGGIPGFPLIYAGFGILTLMGMVMLWSQRKGKVL